MENGANVIEVATGEPVDLNCLLAEDGLVELRELIGREKAIRLSPDQIQLVNVHCNARLDTDSFLVATLNMQGNLLIFSSCSRIAAEDHAHYEGVYDMIPERRRRAAGLFEEANISCRHI